MLSQAQRTAILRRPCADAGDRLRESTPAVVLNAADPGDRNRGEGVKRSDPHPEEQTIVQAAPEIAPYVAALKQKGRKVVMSPRPGSEAWVQDRGARPGSMDNLEFPPESSHRAGLFHRRGLLLRH